MFAPNGDVFGTYIFLKIESFSDHVISLGAIEIPLTEEVIQYLEVAILAAVVVTIIATVVVFRRGEEF